jgi:uncharacterized tellurite resistance protein B-like protein
MEQDPRRSIARLAAAVMTADGRITPDECAALARFDRLGLGPLATLIETEVMRAMEGSLDVAADCATLASLGPHAAAVILATLTEIAASDRQLSPRELEVLRDTGTRLGLAEPELLHVLETTLQPGAATPAGTPPSSASPQNTLAPQSHPAPRAAPEEPARHDFAPELAYAYGILGVPSGSDAATVDAAYLAIIERYNPAKLFDLGTDFAALAIRRLARTTAAFETIRAAQSAALRETPRPIRQTPSPSELSDLDR